MSRGAMSAGIRRATSADEAEWVAAWESCPYATFFHSPAWYAVWKERTGGALAPCPVRLELDDGPAAVVPLAVRTGRLGLWRHYESSPGWTYGGWLSRDRVSADRGRVVAAWLSERCPELVWRWNPFAGAATALSGLPLRDDHTRVLDLDGGWTAFERGLAERTGDLARKFRYDVRRAREGGATARRARGDEDWDAYLACYRASLERWGERATTRYEPAFFASLRAHGGDGVRLWIAEHDGRVVAGALCLDAPLHVAYWHGAARAEDLALRPVHLVLLRAIRDACERGKRWFDFNPSGGLAGVERFKESFGTRVLASPIVERSTPAGRVRRVLSAMTAWR